MNTNAEPDKADYEAPAIDVALDTAKEVPKDEVTLLKEENAALKDRALRALADFENLRRRSEKDVADASAYAITKFARDMLNVADNLRRGIESVEIEGTAEAKLASLLEGVGLTEKELHAILARFGVVAIAAEGAKFDPNKHQALFEVEDAEKPHGTVVQVIQSGFAIGERTLRPAMVAVSKGGAKV